MAVNKNSGFTIIELTIGMFAAAILALTTGCMLFYFYRGWMRMQTEADMHRDGALAMETMELAVRGASNVTWNAGSGTLSVTNDAGVGVQFLRYGTASLVSRASGRSDFPLVRSGVTGFTCTTNATINSGVSKGMVNITLNLTIGSGARVLSSSVCPRE